MNSLTRSNWRDLALTAAQQWMERYGLKTLRICVGVVYFWFGALKFHPVVAVESEYLPAQTMHALSLGLLSPGQGTWMLAIWECAIGFCLATSVLLRPAIALTFLHLLVMLLPTVLFPRQIWHTFPYGLTLKGQYIVKNLVFFAGAAALATSLPRQRGPVLTALNSWSERHRLRIIRLGLGVVYLWFGALKYFPGVSPAEILAGDTVERITFGLMPPGVGLPVLATWECLIGIGLLLRVLPRIVLLLIFVHLLGTFTPFLFFPERCWFSFPFVLTLEGKYIVRNLVLFSAALVLGTSVAQRNRTAATRPLSSEGEDPASADGTASPRMPV